MQGLKLHPTANYWFDTLMQIDPLQVSSDLTNVQYLGQRGVPPYNIYRALSMPQAKDSGVRNLLWTSFRQLADMGLEPRELDTATYKIAKGLETN